MAGKRVIINLVGEPNHGLLAESRFVERPFLPGGEHNMYELAFAAAVAGFDVELRGWLDRPAFQRLAETAGRAPRVELPARMPEVDEIVIVPEGWQDPIEYLSLFLSPASLILFLLAPPGLFGWPFTGPGWLVPDPLTVPLDAVALPEHFQAMNGLGFKLVTHSPGIVAAARAAGVPCEFVGTGRPEPPIAPPGGARRPVDVAALTANRWGRFVSELAPRLADLTVDLIDESPNDEVLARLSRARVLLWPSRIEGHATIPWEARAVGCVPVALSSNRFAVGLSDDCGAVLVDEIDQLEPAIRALLSDEPRWRALSARASRTAAAEVAWQPFVERVASFIGAIVGGGVERLAAWGMGEALRGSQAARGDEVQRRLEELEAEDRRVREDRDRQWEERERLRAALDSLKREYDSLERNYDALRGRRAVRLALSIAELRRNRGT